jgi:IS4 transposase
MSAKISSLSELGNVLRQKEKIDEGVLGFSKQFKIGRLLQSFSAVKKQGYSLTLIFVALILSRLGGLSVYAAQKTGQLDMDDNTMYRLMNNQLIDWKSILLSFAKQFIRCVCAKGEVDEKAVKCFVLDDTDIEKCGKTFEGISKIYSHKDHRFLFGFKLLLLCYWDGKSLIPCGLSLHRESKDKKYGLTEKQQKRLFRGKRSGGEGYFSERYDELDQKKLEVAIQTVKQCVKRGLLCSYILMDSWFVTDFMLKGVRSIRKGMLHVVGMCKMDKRKFCVDGKERNSQTIIKMNENNSRKVHSCRKYKSRYFTVVANYKGTPVKLFYIKYKNAKHWTLLLTTDLSLSFVKAMELYQIRWSIEVLFKECKQYL